MDVALMLLVFVAAATGTLVWGLALKWVDRKVTARVQWRVGPPACRPVKQGVRVVGGAFRELAQAAQDAPAGPCNPQGAPLE